ncbi:MAG: transporter substrate-binding domain-containing protein [Devosia sp.]
MKTLVLAIAAIAALTAGAHAQSYKIATEGSYPPYNFTDDSGKLGGYDIDVGTEMCKRAGVECTFITNDWDSIIPNLLANNYDAIMDDMSITDERKQTIAFTDPYFPPDPSTYLTLSTTKVDYANIKGMKLGAQKATIQAGYLDQNFKADNTILTYDTQDQEMADLNAGNLDIIFLDGSVVAEAVAASGGKLKADGPEILIGDGVGVGMRQSDADLTKKFDTALAAMKADGALDALIAKYFPEKAGGPFYKK